ncbi:hypothetical protein J4Q44_G00087760 [Coregonus suidteri]|uniref:C2 domain-containing protein n=1 Tax=Coregonus suidteri TaxID=861788 RepID=A0AAN8QZ30_9TELE
MTWNDSIKHTGLLYRYSVTNDAVENAIRENKQKANRFTICHKTEVVKNTLNPVWQSFTIPVRALCNGDFDRTIKIEVYDWDRDGSHDFIGEFTTSYRELARGQSQFNVYENNTLEVLFCKGDLGKVK